MKKIKKQKEYLIKNIEEIKELIEKDHYNLHLILKLIESSHHNDPGLKEEIYHAFIMLICIKYENFTVLTMKLIFNEKHFFNQPLFYTKQILKKFKFNSNQEFNDLVDSWEYYNSLKHINAKSEIKVLNFLHKHQIEKIEDIWYFIYNSLINILNLFKDIFVFSN